MTVRITKLDNGVHVITDSMPHLETVALGVWVRAGARDETRSGHGIAHLLEHMAFKGTTRRSARRIAEEIEAAGGEINASTAMETTTYYARVLKDDWRLALDIIADILNDPVFDERELEREKDVILQEIAAANDTPDDLVFDLAQSAAFGTHPLGRSILGTATRVMSHTADDITGYRRSQYTAERFVVSAAGKLAHEELVAEVTALFAGIDAGPGIYWVAPKFQGGLAKQHKPVDQIHSVMSFPAPSYRDPEIYTAQLLANILGGGMSSRLFQEVRENRGLCYSVFAFAAAYADAGLMSIYAATSPEKSRELQAVSSSVALSLCDGIAEDELDRAKAQLKAAMVMNLESASGRADQIARQFQAFGEVPDVFETLEKIDAVQTGAIQDLAQDLFAGHKPAMGATGDLSSLESYDIIARRFA